VASFSTAGTDRGQNDGPGDAGPIGAGDAGMKFLAIYTALVNIAPGSPGEPRSVRGRSRPYGVRPAR